MKTEVINEVIAERVGWDGKHRWLGITGSSDDECQDCGVTRYRWERVPGNRRKEMFGVTRCSGIEYTADYPVLAAAERAVYQTVDGANIDISLNIPGDGYLGSVDVSSHGIEVVPAVSIHDAEGSELHARAECLAMVIKQEEK